MGGKEISFDKPQGPLRLDNGFVSGNEERVERTSHKRVSFHMVHGEIHNEG
jgi:hypothetical protein